MLFDRHPGGSRGQVHEPDMALGAQDREGALIWGDNHRGNTVIKVAADGLLLLGGRDDQPSPGHQCQEASVGCEGPAFPRTLIRSNVGLPNVFRPFPHRHRAIAHTKSEGGQVR
jgi:hypothetical protein